MRSFVVIIAMVGCCFIGGSRSTSHAEIQSDPSPAVEVGELIVLDDQIGAFNRQLFGPIPKVADENRNEAFIETTGEGYMYAAEGELIDVRFDTPNARGALAWKCSGLPVGVSINSGTGVISGRPQYDQAGNHPVKLTATSPRGDTSTVSFTWIVSDSNRWPWVDTQFHRVGEKVSVPFRATDAVGNALTYTFVDLPPGVKFDEKLGLVGEIETGADGTYEVTANVSGGGATDSKTFDWRILSENRITAVFAINDTFVHSDDVLFVGSQTRMLVKYYLSGNERGPIKIEVTSGAATVTTKEGDLVGSKSVIFQLTDWPIGWLRLYSIAKAPSAANDDIVVEAFRWVDGSWVPMN